MLSNCRITPSIYIIEIWIRVSTGLHCIMYAEVLRAMIRDSSVGIATGYGMEGRDSIPQRQEALGPSQPLIQ
jgi:hypothetical protein